ncbi:hypothetical protein J7E88_21440 [Streptomyces sp. ISL-10]|uniref:DUF6882 domain-containing protein n=1 Tax=Streptomyces sp. ISL-10 TaxID=2819172 RepID=UPI001BEBB63F|nr:DUF6882 domain-containing protein [Streptomyces sp. ISL-10]MBT2367802.1 hypothetical protein [Streptomyces sp. ISL-10]
MTMTFSEPFLRLTEEHSAWGAEQLEIFNEFLPVGEWSADLGQCLYRQAGRELRISLLGTLDTDEQSWLWAWANPGFEGTPVARAAEEVRRYGQANGLREFTDDLVRLAGHDDPRRAAETLAFAAMGVLGATGYIGVQANASARAYLVPDDPQVPRAEPDAITLPRVLLTGAALLGGSARQVVSGYFAHHGLPHREAPGRMSAGLPDGGTVDVLFDDLDRIASVSINTGDPATT